MVLGSWTLSYIPETKDGAACRVAVIARGVYIICDIIVHRSCVEVDIKRILCKDTISSICAFFVDHSLTIKTKYKRPREPQKGVIIRAWTVAASGGRVVPLRLGSPRGRSGCAGRRAGAHHSTPSVIAVAIVVKCTRPEVV